MFFFRNLIIMILVKRSPQVQNKDSIYGASSKISPSFLHFVLSDFLYFVYISACIATDDFSENATVCIVEKRRILNLSFLIWCHHHHQEMQFQDFSKCKKWIYVASSIAISAILIFNAYYHYLLAIAQLRQLEYIVR